MAGHGNLASTDFHTTGIYRPLFMIAGVDASVKGSVPTFTGLTQAEAVALELSAACGAYKSIDPLEAVHLGVTKVPTMQPEPDAWVVILGRHRVDQADLHCDQGA